MFEVSNSDMMRWELYYKGRYYSVTATTAEGARKAIREEFGAQTERECFITKAERVAS